MRKVVRPVAIFVLLYLIASLILHLGMPHLLAWHEATCASPSRLCSSSTLFLSYWWLAWLPMLAIVTLLIDRILARRRVA